MAVIATDLAFAQSVRGDDLTRSRHKLSLAYRLGFNMSGQFERTGESVSANNPSITGRSYVDGFVGTDNTANAGGYTSYWGYQDTAQVIDNNEYLLLRAADSGSLGKDPDDGLQSSLELGYLWEMGAGRSVSWGFAGAINWMPFNASQGTSGSASSVAVDAFELGYTPPIPPFVGTPNAGPFSPLLGVDPMSLAVSTTAELDASIFGVRLGPYVEIPLGNRFFARATGGLVINVVDGDYQYSETFLSPAGARLVNVESSSKVAATFGGYLGVQLGYELTDRLSLLGEIRYEGTTDYDIKTSHTSGSIEFRWTGNALLGINYSF